MAPEQPPAATTGPRVIAREDVRIVPKPWGEEWWLAHEEHYAAKILIVKKGHRLSLQYHARKHETQFVEMGRIRYILGEAGRPDEHREVIVEAGSVIVLPPGSVHRLEALEDTRIFEVSTPELDDVIRIEDDYGREGTDKP